MLKDEGFQQLPMVQMGNHSTDHTGRQFITGNTHTHTQGQFRVYNLLYYRVGILGQHAGNGPDATTTPQWNRLCFLLLTLAGLNLFLCSNTHRPRRYVHLLSCHLLTFALILEATIAA